jgi:dTDP-4-amino-4,6-dideoxygalactose transaminase/glycosyltransferase involved in cell wall biosynthesis
MPHSVNKTEKPVRPATKLHVGLPNMPDERAYLQRVQDLLASRRVTNGGPLVQQFERKICDTLGVPHAVAVCNGTLGLQIAAKALGLQGEVIMPSFTFVATAHAFEWIGLEPVFVDIDPATHNIDPAKIAQAVTPRTSAVVGVHVWGTPCDTAAIEGIARQHGLKVIYDAAHAFGCSRGGTMIGNFGDCEVFSFHATKFVHTFEGGVITTNDDALADKMRLMRNFGFDGYDSVVGTGINAKMPEVCAAMGLCNLESMGEFVERNRRNHELYRAHLQDLPGISVFAYDPGEQGNYQYVVFEVDPLRCSASRDDLVRALHAEGILARRYFWPGCHRMEPYLSNSRRSKQKLPATDEVASRVIILPTGQAIGDEEVHSVRAVLQAALEKGDSVHRHNFRAAAETVCNSPAGERSKPAPITAHLWPAEAAPVVSICCYTYNQAHMIGDAIAGFLMQETDFPVEIVLQDDASSDGTDEIIRSRAAELPRIFRPVFHAENSRSRGYSPMLSCLSHCRGEFVAMCEGDDYWTDPHKLQRQVDFLRENPDCVGCIHDARVVDGAGKVLMESCIDRKAGRYTRDDCVKWLLSGYPTASLVFRRDALCEMPDYLRNRPRDTTLDIAITKHGNLGVLDANMCIYREHAGSTWAAGSKIGRYLRNYEMFNELLLDDELRRVYGPCLRGHLKTVRRKIKSEATGWQSMKQSLSWRITKPLRQFRRLVDGRDIGND